MAKQKFYVVWVGRKPGIYTSWPECQDQVNKFDEAKFKSYETNSAAEKAFQDGWKKHWGQGGKPGQQAAQGSGQNPGQNQGQNHSQKLDQKSGQRSALKSQSGTQAHSAKTQDNIEWDSISVDVGTEGNPGKVEYKGVDTKTGEILFSCGPISKGTNNLGEFLAIVHALAYLKKLGSGRTVYSDSRNALKWVQQKKVASTLARDASTKEIWELVDRAIKWLETNTYSNKVLKWETKHWGEIKADYGRKS